MVLSERLEEIERRAEAATEGPWSWSYIGEKANGYVVGQAFHGDGTPVSGFVDDDTLMGDDFLSKSVVGEHEAATCNYGNAAFIAAARTDIPTLVAALREAVGALEAIQSLADGPPYGQAVRGLAAIARRLEEKG